MSKSKTKAEMAVALLRKHPELPLSSIGKLLGVSTQYIGQVVQKTEGLAAERGRAKEEQRKERDELLDRLGARMKPYGGKN